MGTKGKVYATNIKVSGGADATERPCTRTGTAHRQLVLMWLCGVLVPWVLQLRSFSELVMRHKITPNLIPSSNAPMVETVPELAAHCPVQGLLISGSWYNIYPSHYYESETVTDGSVLCHFVIPQYNMHGTYNVQNRRVEPQSSAPRSCANNSYGITYYFYHGSIGYYSFYAEGEGSYCTNDGTGYVLTSAIGSSDINFNALAKYDGAPGYHSSYFFGIVGSVWLAYRSIVLARSYASCSRYGRRLDAIAEPISIPSAVVFIQQAARIAPHTATNWHRLGLVYLLVEGLMTDLFLLIAHEGFGAKIQYISLGYNIAGLLSMLFEIVENTKLLKPSTQLLVKRVLFNSELTIWGEALFSAAMSHYLTALNHSDIGDSVMVAEAISHYLWGLVSHGIIVLGQTAFILTVRVLGTLVLVQLRYGSLKMLTAPCCVDLLMGYRYKLATITGYVYHNSRLCYTQETLKAHGLLKMSDAEGKEFLIYHKIHWLPSAREDLSILGKLTGEHVELCLESAYSGPVSVCDRMLGGATEEDWELGSDELDELESARLVNGSVEPSDRE